MSSSYSASSDDYRSGSSSSTPSTIGYTAAVDGMYENQSENALDDRRFYRDDDLMDMLRKRPSSKRDIMHIDYADVSPRRWRTHYEPMKVPIMIHGMPEELGWAAPKKWTKKRLVREYGEVRFNIGAAPDHVKLKHYIKYCERDGEKVDAPVYLFDSDIQDREDSAALLDDFSNPAYFDQDHFKMIPETKRPDYRWLICGPARSGTTPHTDPNGTSAWNTLLVGRKRWCIFRPELSRKEVFGNGRKSMPKEEEAIHWFSDIFPTLKERGIEYWDVMQEAGETIFVPGMWWHVVVNVEFTVSITQNFASDANFDEVYTYTRQKRPRFNRRWLKLLKTEEPALFERAKELDVHEGSNGWSSTSSDWSEVDALPGPPTHPGCAFETWSFSSVFSGASGTSASASSSAASSSEKKSKKKKKGKKGKTKKAKGKSKGGKSKGSKAKAKGKGKKKGKKKAGKMG